MAGSFEVGEVFSLIHTCTAAIFGAFYVSCAVAKKCPPKVVHVDPSRWFACFRPKTGFHHCGSPRDACLSDRVSLNTLHRSTIRKTGRSLFSPLQREGPPPSCFDFTPVTSKTLALVLRALCMYVDSCLEERANQGPMHGRLRDVRAHENSPSGQDR